MTTTDLDLTTMPALGVESSPLKTLIIEPLLVLGVSAFWLVALPFVAASLIAVKVWDTLTFRPDPLFLRSGVTPNQFASRQTAAMSKAAHA